MQLASNPNILIAQMEQNLSGYGLYQGTLGLSMANFILWKQTGQAKLKAKALNFLNETINHIQTLDGNYKMDNGLLGFGWGIIWLTENQFIKLNVNDFLEDLDDTVYKIAVYDNVVDRQQDIDKADVILYLMARTNNKNITSQSFYRNVCHIECIKILMDKLCKAVDTAKELQRADIVFCVKMFCLFNKIKEAKGYAKNVLLQDTFAKLNEILSPDKTKNMVDMLFKNLQMGANFVLLKQLDPRNKLKWKEAWYL